MGYYHGCALDGGGVPICWGYASDGATDPPPTVQFDELTAGDWHTCGITTNNALRCWGWGSPTTLSSYDCINNGNCGQADPPIGQHQHVAAGGKHSCATDFTTGEVSCWGDNSAGQINAPTGVAFRQLSLGWEHSCGITEDGRMMCWGAGSATSIGHCDTWDSNCGQSIVP